MFLAYNLPATRVYRNRAELFVEKYIYFCKLSLLLMNVIIATLGNRDDPVRTLVRSESADKLIVIAGKPVKDIPGMEVLEAKKEINPIEIAENLKSDLEHSINLNVEIETVNAFDFDDCLKAMIAILIRESKSRRIIGVTGGTKLLSGAAMCACWIEGVEAFYVLEKPEKIITLPVPGPGYFKELGKTKEEILICLKAGKKATNKIADSVGIRANTVSDHLRILEEWRMVKGEKGQTKRKGHGEAVREVIDKRVTEWSLTPVGKFYAEKAKEEKAEEEFMAG
jgi:CRISPR locus-related DNA-binding protein